jgi:hypothetical protein
MRRLSAVAAMSGALAAGLLAVPVLLLPAASAFQLSPGLGPVPPGLVALAVQAGNETGTDPNLLLAIAKVECDFGRCRSGASASLVPPDILAHVDAAALAPGGAIAVLLGLPSGISIGDWVDPVAVGGEHALGFMQFLPSTWREEAPLAPGHPEDPFDPLQAMVVAGSYLQRLMDGAMGRTLSLRDAVAAYGGGSYGYADRVLALAGPALAGGPAPVAGVQVIAHPGPVFPGVPSGGYPTYGYAPGNCTWWVAYNRPVPQDLGDAWEWLGNAAAHGLATSTEPTPGSIVVYARGDGYSTYGHVALVIGVQAGSFTVSEMNYVGLGVVDERTSPWPDPTHVEGFIL